MQYRQLLVALAANVGAFLFGNLLAWSAPAAGQIIGDEIYGFPVSDFQFAWTVGLMALGGALSSNLSGIIRSEIGTRLTILLFGIPLLVGWVLIATPINPAMVSHKIEKN